MTDFCLVIVAQCLVSWFAGHLDLGSIEDGHLSFSYLISLVCVSQHQNKHVQ